MLQKTSLIQIPASTQSYTRMEAAWKHLLPRARIRGSLHPLVMETRPNCDKDTEPQNFFIVVHAHSYWFQQSCESSVSEKANRTDLQEIDLYNPSRREKLHAVWSSHMQDKSTDQQSVLGQLSSASSTCLNSATTVLKSLQTLQNDQKAAALTQDRRKH